MKWLSRVFNRKPKVSGRRQYAGAKTGRLSFYAGTSSADAELTSSLRQLRDRSRVLVRDVVYAKRAKTVIVNNVIGQGIGLQAQVRDRNGEPAEINNAIEAAWREWSRSGSCHTGGRLHFSDLERAALGEVFEAGECFVRIHPRAFGGSDVPLSLEVIEAERLADDHEIKAPEGAQVTLGIEHDSYGRALAYYVHSRHPHEFRIGQAGKRDEILRIPADQMLHLYLVDRWPQTRGVPWLHAAINRLNQLGEFEDAAVVAARIGASKVGFFENSEPVGNGIADDVDANGTPVMTAEAGEFTQLPPGYTLSTWDPNYPNETFDPFTRACLRGIAAGVGPSYESLSRDYSQSNYSSSRLALLDDRDLWRVLQQWWIRSFREELHRHWLQAAALAGAITGLDRADYALDRGRYEAVKFKPRGWGWVDPTKEVKAYKEAEKAGYLTKADIISMTAGGLDIEDVLQARRAELDLIANLDLETDTTVSQETPEASKE